MSPVFIATAAQILALVSAQTVDDIDDEALGDFHPEGPQRPKQVPAPTPPPPPDPQTSAQPPAAPPAPVAEKPAPQPVETAAVHVRVLARGSRDPVVGAAVLVGTEIVTVTDEQGRFTVSLPRGPHTIQIQQPGFQTLDLAVEVGGDAFGALPSPERMVRLQPQLTGQRYETVVLPPDPQADKITVRDEELTRTPGSLGDPLRVIESLPGVSQVVWPLALYTVRGANPGNTGFFLDGLRLPQLYHFALGPSVVHPFFIEQVDFYPGGYPANYGRYVSGIVSAETRTPKSDRTRGSVDVRLLDAGGIVVQPINGGKGSVAVAGRASYTGLLFSLFSDDYTLNYWDYQLRFEHELGPGRLTVFSFGAGDSMGRKEVDDTNVDIMFHRASVAWRGAVGGGRLSSSATVGYDTADAFIPQVNNLPVGTRSWNALSRVGYQHALGSRADLHVGVDGELQRINPQAIKVALQAQNILEDRTVLMHGGFVTFSLKPWDWLLIAPGFRYDFFAQEGATAWAPQPRANARLRVGRAADQEIWLKGSFGRFAQLPSLPIAVPGFENFGLQSVGLQKGIQGSAGIEAPLGRQATLEVNGFYQFFDVTDLKSIFNFDVQTSLLELRPGQAYGVEIMLRRPATHRLHGWIAYTLSKSERSLPPDNAVARSDWDQRHILNLVASYRLGGGYQAGGRVHYNTGRPYPVFDQGSIGMEREPVNYRDLPDFFQLDLRFDKRWVLDTYVFDLYIELINTTLTRQVYDIKVQPDGTLDKRGFRAAVPSIGMHVEW